MHAAKIEHSARLQRLRDYLRECGPRGATSLELAQACGPLVAVSTEISALRHNGYTVRSLMERVTETGSRVWRYFLES